MVKRSDHSTSSTDKEVVADQAAKLKAKDAPLGQLQDVLPGTEIGWVATEVEGAQLPDVGMQPAADTPQASAAVDSDLSVVTDAEATQPHVEQLGEPVTEAAALSPSSSSSGVEQVAGASAWLGYGGDEVGAQAGAGAAQSGLIGNDFTVTPLPSAGSTPAVNVHVGVDGGTPLGPQTLSMLTASGDTTGQLREDGQQITSGQLSTAGASGAVSWQLDHSTGLYGQLQLSGNGHWRYTLDNASSRVQGLCAGEQVSEHFIAAVTDSAGRTQFIPLTIAIDGSADRAIISGTDVGQANEDKLLLVSGMLTVQDADAGQAQFKPAVLTGSFGLLTLDTVGHWVYELDNAKPAVQALGAGKAATDVLTVTSVDGTTHQVTITVHGSNDQALIVGTQSGVVSEDSLLSVQGRLSVTDIDQGEASFVPQTLAGTFGQLQLDMAGYWTYLLDNTNPAVQALGAGAAATDILTVTTLDGTPQQITITIKGSNDAAQIAGTLTGAVTEESTLVAKGTLTVTDVDQGQAGFNPEVFNGQYGSFSLDATGHWLYVLDNSNAAVQGLAAGEQVRDVMTVTSVDGTSCQLVVSVNGSNDAPVLAAQSQAVTEDGARLGGRMVATDVDTSDTHVFSTGTTVAGFTLNADGSYSFDPSNAAYQHLVAGQTQDVVIPVIVTDSAGATSTQNLTITVTGTNDAAVVSGRLTNTLTEDSVVSTGGMLRAGGQLSVVDPDAGEAVFVVQAGVTGVGHYGSFSIDASGHYSYIADNTQAAIQRLKAGETLTDRFTVATADGTQQVVTITINGAEDRPVLHAQTHAVTEDGARLTGQMLATDVDAGDTQRFSVAHPVAGFVLNPDGSFSFNPATASYQHLAAGQTQDVVIPVTVIDSAGGTSTQNLTITVTGKNDGATISGVNTGSTAEDNTQAVTGQLTVADVDDGQAHFVAQSGSAGTYGTFSLNEQGQWSYSLDNSKASVQALKTGDSVTDSFTVTSADGTTHQVSVTVTGKDDGAVIGGADSGTVTEDQSITAGKIATTGQLSVTDPDAGQDHFNAQVTKGLYGTFTIDAAGNWEYSADNSRAAIQGLKAGATLTDSMTVTSADHTSHTVSVTIQGSNDAPTLTAQTQSVTEDGAQLTGKMVATDVDQGDTQAFSTQNPPAGFTLNADGSYSFDPADAAYQHLAAGQTQTLTIPVTVTDSAGATSTQNLSITITGSNDGAIIGGRVANNVTEDSVVSAGGMLRAGGQLTVVDPDAGEAVFVAQTGVSGPGHYGSFSIDASGHYSYTADNTQSVIQQLKAGETLTDRFTVATADGTQQVVTITINGAEDKPVLQAQTHAITEDGARLTGKMLATDVDAGDTQRFSVAHPVAGFALNPDGSFSFNPATASYQHLASGQTQDVVIPVTVIDSAGGTSTQNLTITVTGKNDGATISGVNTGSTAEDNGQAVTGQLTVADVDDGQAHFVAQSGSAGTYGTFSLNEQGQWSYALDNSKASVQALKTGDSVTDSFTVTSADGTTHQVTVTVTGKDDGALIGGADTASVTEDVSVTAGKLEAQGQLTITDPDAGQNHFTAQSNVAGTYGTFSIDQAGHWTYSVNNSQGAVQQLKTGDSLIDSMTIASADGTTHTLLVAIQGSNDAPILTAQAQSVTEDGARLTGKMVATDVDQGDTQFFSTQNPPAGFTLTPDGSYSFDPADIAYQHLGLGQPQVISIPVTVVDSTGLTSTKNLVITITGSNDAPQLAPTPVKILEGAAPIQGQLTATDPDTGDTLTYRANGPVAGFTLNPDGSFSFDPAHAAYNTLGAGQERVVSIPVTVVDGHGGSTTQNLDITVTGTNDGPAITATPQTVKEGDALLQGQLVGTDADSGDTLTYSTTAKPDGFTLNADGSYTFDPAHAAYDDIGLGQTRVLTIPMTVSDGHGGTATQSLQITVIGTNDAPVMVAEPARTTTEDSAILHGQLAATDPDHADTLTYSATATVPGFLINPDGSYTFNPGHGAYNHLAAGQTQVVSIPVEVTDGHGGTGTQTLQISITGADDGPSFVIAGTRSATEGGPVLTGQLTATDPDSGDTLTYASGAQVAGFALNADGSYTFDPSHADYDSLGIGHSKTVSVPITVTDSQGQSVTQTLRITIAGSNDNPTVSAVAPSTVAEDSTVLQGRLTIADVDAGDTLTCRTSATVAGFNLNPNGSYTFDPGNHAYDHLAPGDSEVLSIPVTVSDGHGGLASQTLQITITGSNDGPALTVVDQTVSEGATVLHGQFAGTDPDRGDTLTYSTSATVAGFTLNADGSYNFDAAHAAYNSLGVGHSQVVSVPITVTDSHGATVTRSLQITIDGTDDVPVLTATPRSVNEGDASIQGRLTATDPDVGDALTYSTTATIAGFRLTPDGSYTFDPSNAAYNSLAAGTSQNVTIPVTVSDGHGGSTTQNLVITVAGVNDAAHISGARTGTVTEDTGAIAGKITTTGTLTVTDPDVGQDHFNALVSNGHYGVFTLDAAGQWTYSADNSKPEIQQLKAGATLTDSFTVTSADGTAHTVTVTVAGSNDAPVLQAQTQAVTEDGTQLTGQMVATDVDAGDTKAFSMANSVDGFTLNADGSYVFDPSHASYQHLAAGQTQDVVIPVTVTDSAGATSTQNLSITITGSNDGAIIGGRVANNVTEDSVVSAGGMLRAGGQLTVVDPDAGEAVFVAQTSVTGAGHYGSFSIDASGHYSYTADNTQRAIQQLKAGETLTDRFTVATADGTQQVVTITINGAEDKPVLQAQTHAVTEDGARLTGKMLATDVDAGDTQRFSVAHPVAGFALNPDGSFSFNPATASYQHLASGQTQDVVIPITVIDSTGGTSTQNLTITVTGVNDRAVISGVSNGTITEDQGVSATHTLSCGGKLDVTDVDTGEAAFAVQHGAGANGYGNFVLDPSGNWTYSADNTQSAIQQLKAGETLTDTFTVSSTDGTTHTVTVTIQGTNDAPVLAAQTQAVTEDGTLLQGRMVATDVDANDTQAFSIAQPVDGFTLNTDGSYSFDPSHASYQHLAAGQTQTMTIPVTVTDSEGATSTQNLTIRLTGTNDAPHISGADVGRVVEDQTLSVNGQLQITDADDGQAHFVAQTAKPAATAV